MELEYRDDPVDSILQALADQRRRSVIQYLRDTSDGVGRYEELAEYVCSHRTGANDIEEVRSSLHHIALPVLDDAELIEYDSRSETVVYKPNPLAEDILDAIEEHHSEGSL